MQTRGKGLQFQTLQNSYKNYRMLGGPIHPHNSGCFSQGADSRIANQKHNNTLVCPEVQVESEHHIWLYTNSSMIQDKASS